MTINESLGVVHDAFFYCVAYFNRKLVECPTDIVSFEKIHLSNYDGLKSSKNVLDPPEIFYPLFYCDGKRSCVVTAYFNQYVDLFYNTIDDFYSLLLDTSKFKKFVMEYYFGSYFNERELQRLCLAEGETVVRAVAILSKVVDIEHFTYMFFHFRELAGKVVDFFKHIIPLIESYHAKQKKQTLDIVQKFISGDTERLVRKRLMKSGEGDSIQLENQTYSVCYLNQHILKSSCQNRKYIFILGCDFHIFFANSIDYRHVTMQSIIKSIGHPVKIEIINELRKKDLTISQLARRLQLARTSITRYIEDLLDELVIAKARKSGTEIYYCLNAAYFEKAKTTITHYLDETILDIHKP